MSERISHWRTAMAVVGFMAWSGGAAWAQVPNGSFEEGGRWPQGWTLSDGIGAWECTGHAGARCISLTEDGKGRVQWTSDTFPLSPGKSYLLSAWLKSAAGHRSIVCLGTPKTFWSLGVNHREWKQCRFFFQAPKDPVSWQILFWAWHTPCKILLDDVRLVEARAVHRSRDGIELGVAERIEGNQYRVGPVFPPTTGIAGPGCRFLWKPQDVGYHGNRWFVHPQGVVLRHQIAGIEQTEARLRFHNGWNPRGKVIVSVSNDGKNYQTLHQTRTLYWNGPLALPSRLFPAKEVYLLFQCVKTPEDNDGYSPVFELTGYEYEATLAKTLPAFQGETEFVEVPQ